MSDSEDMKRYLQEVGHPTEEQLTSSLTPKQYLNEVSTEPQETFESKYLEPNVYPVMGAAAKALDVASTPVQMAMSVPVQAILATQKALTNQPLPEFVNPITSPLEAANKYGSTRTLFEEVPGLNKALFPNLNIPQAPKASAALSQATGAEALALPADILATHGMAKGLGMAGLANKFANLASDNREIALLNNSSLPASDNTRLVNNKVFKRVGDTLAEYGLDKYLKSPDVLYEKLTGKTEQVPDPATGVLQVKKGDSILSQEGKKINDLMTIADPKVPKVLAADIADGIFQEISGQKGGKNSGIPGGWGNAQDLDLKRQIINITGSDEKSLSDLVELKRNIQDTVFNMTDEQKAAMSQKYPNYKEIYNSAWKWIDNYINAAAESDDDVRNFVQQNARFSDLKTASQALEGSRLTNLATPSLIQAVGTMEAGKEMGIPFMAREMRQKTGYIARKLPAFMGQVQENISGALTNPTEHPRTIIPPSMGSSIYNQYQKMPQDQPMQVGRIPQSIPTEMQAKAMQRGLVENLADYEIPRNSQQILANPQMALAKIAQQPNVDPQFIKGLQDALEKHPDKLKTTLPLMIMQFPNLFAADKYDRCDGKIGCSTPDPIMKQQLIQRAYKDVELRKDLSNTDKTMLWDGLNRDGSLPETFQ